ncbi:MAG: hypothetical protein U0167_13935 [bacterium]
MATVILHDQRLDGAVEPGRGQVIPVDGSTPLAQAFRDVKAAVVSSPTDLVIACHGFMTHAYDGASHVDLSGGQGLQLCRETLQVGNVHLVDALKGLFSRIWLMACGPAGTLVSSSRPFCREFAAYANTVVIASDTAQRYNPGAHDSASQVSRRVLRFGAWEGNVFQFFPNGDVRAFTRSESPLP